MLCTGLTPSQLLQTYLIVTLQTHALRSVNCLTFKLRKVAPFRQASNASKLFPSNALSFRLC